MIYCIDTEFHEHQHKHGQLVEPISIGIAAEDGRELYIELNDFDEEAAAKHPFLAAEVLPWLGNVTPVARPQAREMILGFVGLDPDPDFWAYFADYDWVVFCCIFGGMTKLPRRWPMLCMDLKQELLNRGYTSEDYPKQEKGNHHALADAKWNLRVLKWMQGRDKLRER